MINEKETKDILCWENFFLFSRAQQKAFRAFPVALKSSDEDDASALIRS